MAGFPCESPAKFVHLPNLAPLLPWMEKPAVHSKAAIDSVRPFAQQASSWMCAHEDLVTMLETRHGQGPVLRPTRFRARRHRVRSGSRGDPGSLPPESLLSAATRRPANTTSSWSGRRSRCWRKSTRFGRDRHRAAQQRRTRAKRASMAGLRLMCAHLGVAQRKTVEDIRVEAARLTIHNPRTSPDRCANSFDNLFAYIRPYSYCDQRGPRKIF
jgi:hypothetical protein